MSERVMRQWVVAGLKPLHAVAVENRVASGTPDVSYSLGWIELKHVERPPARPTTPVALDHYTTEQRIWAHQRAAAGGVVFVLLQVGREIFLIDGTTAADRLGEATLAEIRQMAVEKWTSIPNPRTLTLAVLSHSRPRPPKSLSSSVVAAAMGWSTPLPSTT